MNEQEIARQLAQALSGDLNMIVGSASVLNDGTVNVFTNGKVINAIPTGVISSGSNCLAVKDGNTWYAVGQQNQLVAEQVRSRRYRQQVTPPQLTYPFKILFSVVEDGVRKFYVGGDRATPKFVFQSTVSHGVLTHYGFKQKEWKVQAYNSPNLIFYSPENANGILVGINESITLVSLGWGFFKTSQSDGTHPRGWYVPNVGYISQNNWLFTYPLANVSTTVQAAMPNGLLPYPSSTTVGTAVQTVTRTQVNTLHEQSDRYITNANLNASYVNKEVVVTEESGKIVNLLNSTWTRTKSVDSNQQSTVTGNIPSFQLPGAAYVYIFFRMFSNEDEGASSVPTPTTLTGQATSSYTESDYEYKTTSGVTYVAPDRAKPVSVSYSKIYDRTVSGSGSGDLTLYRGPNLGTPQNPLYFFYARGEWQSQGEDLSLDTATQQESIPFAVFNGNDCWIYGVREILNVRTVDSNNGTDVYAYGPGYEGASDGYYTQHFTTEYTDTETYNPLQGLYYQLVSKYYFETRDGTNVLLDNGFPIVMNLQEPLVLPQLGEAGTVTCNVSYSNLSSQQTRLLQKKEYRASYDFNFSLQSETQTDYKRQTTTWTTQPNPAWDRIVGREIVLAKRNPSDDSQIFQYFGTITNYTYTESQNSPPPPVIAPTVPYTAREPYGSAVTATDDIITAHVYNVYSQNRNVTGVTVSITGSQIVPFDSRFGSSSIPMLYSIGGFSDLPPLSPTNCNMIKNSNPDNGVLAALYVANYDGGYGQRSVTGYAEVWDIVDGNPAKFVRSSLLASGKVSSLRQQDLFIHGVQYHPPK